MVTFGGLPEQGLSRAVSCFELFFPTEHSTPTTSKLAADFFHSAASEKHTLHLQSLGHTCIWFLGSDHDEKGKTKGEKQTTKEKEKLHNGQKFEGFFVCFAVPYAVGKKRGGGER